MTAAGGQGGGALAKLLVVLLVAAVGASAALYAYGTRQQPLAIDRVTVSTSDGRPAPAPVALGDELSIATVVRNEGRLSVTLEGLDPGAVTKDQPMVASAISLGDGRTPASAAAFEPTALDPGEGIGVLVRYEVNPALACRRMGPAAESVPMPPLPLRFTTYGIEGTQSIDLGPDAPSIELDPDACAASTGG